jgi:hypothetical protein
MIEKLSLTIAGCLRPLGMASSSVFEKIAAGK